MTDDYRARQDRQVALQAKQQIEYCERKAAERLAAADEWAVEPVEPEDDWSAL